MRYLLTSLVSFLRRANPRAAASFLDADMLDSTKAAATALFLKVLGSLSAFILNIVIARLLGVEGAGIYFIALSITMISSVVARLGLDNALLRIISIQFVNGECDRIRSVHGLGVRMVVLCAGLISVIIFLSSTWIAVKLFNKPELTEPLRWMTLSILPFALLNIQAESLKAIRHLRAAMLIQGAAIPFISLILICLLGGMTVPAEVAKAYSAASLVTVLLGINVWRQAMPQYSVNAKSFPFYELWASCKPLLLIAIINRAFTPWAPMILLGVWADSEDVGVYGAATRVSLIVGLILVAINSAFVPRFAEFHTKGNFIALGRMAKRVALLSLIIASPLFIVIFSEADEIMTLFGDRFSEGSNILIVLTVGQIANVMCGSVGYLLIVSGNEILYRNIMIVSAAIHLLLIAALAPALGPIGAALASAISLIGLNISAMVGVYQRLGIGTVLGIKGRNEYSQ